MMQRVKRSVFFMMMFMVLFLPHVSQGEESEPIKLAYGRKIHYAPQIIAFEQGYFKEQGVNVKGLILMAGIQCAEALTTGSVEAAVMGDSPSIFAAASGFPLRLVAAYGGGERMHRIVVAKNSRIVSPHDLVGRKVAVQRGSSTHGAFILFCRKMKIDPAQIDLINLSPTIMPEAMLSGQIDAAVGSEPWPSNILVKVPGSRELAVLSGLGNRFPLMMLVTEKAAQEPQKVVRLLAATQKSIELINSQPDRAAAIISRVTGVPAERELNILKTLEWGLSLNDDIKESLIQTADFLVKEGLLTQRPDFGRLFDQSFLATLNNK